MKVTIVKLQFQGSSTVNETYEIHVNNLKEAIQMIPLTEKAMIGRIKLELKELLAIVENKETNYQRMI